MKRFVKIFFLYLWWCHGCPKCNAWCATEMDWEHQNKEKRDLGPTCAFPEITSTLSPVTEYWRCSIGCLQKKKKRRQSEWVIMSHSHSFGKDGEGHWHWDINRSWPCALQRHSWKALSMNSSNCILYIWYFERKAGKEDWGSGCWNSRIGRDQQDRKTRKFISRTLKVQQFLLKCFLVRSPLSISQNLTIKRLNAELHEAKPENALSDVSRLLKTLSSLHRGYCTVFFFSPFLLLPLPCWLRSWALGPLCIVFASAVRHFVWYPSKNTNLFLNSTSLYISLHDSIVY